MEGKELWWRGRLRNLLSSGHLSRQDAARTIALLTSRHYPKETLDAVFDPVSDDALVAMTIQEFLHQQELLHAPPAQPVAEAGPAPPVAEAGPAPRDGSSGEWLLKPVVQWCVQFMRSASHEESSRHDGISTHGTAHAPCAITHPVAEPCTRVKRRRAFVNRM